MPIIETLSIKQIKGHIAHQKAWLEAYQKAAPQSECIRPCQEIIDNLYKELKKRGVECKA